MNKTLGIVTNLLFLIFCWFAVFYGVLALFGCNVANEENQSNDNSEIIYLDLAQKEKCEKCGTPKGLEELGYEYLVCSDICPPDPIEGIDKECDLRCIAERQQIKEDCYLAFDCPQIKAEDEQGN
jgi:hypothetical protein